MFKTIMLNLMIVFDDPVIANELAFSPNPVVVEKAGNSCPIGYRNGKGAYCYNSASPKNTINKVIVIKD